MTYILISSLVILLCWLIFGQKYFTYILACVPAAIFFITGNYLYASIMVFLMFFFIKINNHEQANKKQNRLNATIFATAISALPVAVYFSSKRTFVLEDVHSVFISIILGLLVVFVAAGSALGAGMNRTKGDKETYE